MGKDSAAEFSKKLVDILPKVMQGFLRRQTDALAKGKITAPQYLVLDLIYRQGAQKMSSLAKELNVSLPAMTGLIERLFKLGIVKRIYGEKDRRVITIEMSAKGEDLVKAIRKQRESIFAEIFGRLTQEERVDYLRILLKIKDILFKKEK